MTKKCNEKCKILNFIDEVNEKVSLRLMVKNSTHYVKIMIEELRQLIMKSIDERG
jgi:hypothetical protein